MTKEDILNELSTWSIEYTRLCSAVSDEFDFDYNKLLMITGNIVATLHLDMHDPRNEDILITSAIEHYLEKHNSEEPNAYFYAIVALLYFIQLSISGIKEEE